MRFSTRCSCKRYLRPDLEIQVLSTVTGGFHCFDGVACLDIPAKVDQSTYSPIEGEPWDHLVP